MAVVKRDPMQVIDSINRSNRDTDQPPAGPTVAVNGYVYGSLNHPSSRYRPRQGVLRNTGGLKDENGKDPQRPQNIQGIIRTLDKEKFNQEKLRRQKEKYESFVTEPMMGRNVMETPGVGRKEASRLQRQGIRTATDLREMYLDIGNKEFIDWMGSLGIAKASAKECGQAIHDWCANYLKLPR